jgi:hypothetical protein
MGDIATTSPKAHHPHSAYIDHYHPKTGGTPLPKEAEMARITRVTLDPITVDVANAIVDVEFDVEFSRSDKDANTPYKMVCTLLGEDVFPGVPEDFEFDQVIPNGVLTPVGGQTIRADGQNLQTFHFNKTLELENLNEDFDSEDNPDEIKARVTLTPVIAHATEADSNLQTLTIE